MQETIPTRVAETTGPAAQSENPESSDYWYSLIDESEMATFLDLSVRSLQ